MKKTAMNLLIMAALLVSAFGFAAASAAQTLMSSKIPFAFMVGNRTLPAGRYDISKGATPAILMLQSEGRTHNLGAITNRAVTLQTPQQCHLEFRRYGDQHFLARVWVKGNDSGFELPMSKRERQAADELKNIAGNQAQPALVTIVAE
ncbi:MAG: hypothetical protein HOP19_21260 [Acidobacteria bacterium]|nr:hypothetical protein [Acidobacteriota bacterium]